jgi:hypothetical protein
MTVITSSTNPCREHRSPMPDMLNEKCTDLRNFNISPTARTPRDIVDHLLVIDDGSTDATAEVARSGGADVLSMALFAAPLAGPATSWRATVWPVRFGLPPRPESGAIWTHGLSGRIWEVYSI